eukprot:scaffold133_cov257-Pinguiococcus_pyrenoidosus.AAC.3
MMLLCRERRNKAVELERIPSRSVPGSAQVGPGFKKGAKGSPPLQHSSRSLPGRCRALSAAAFLQRSFLAYKCSLATASITPLLDEPPKGISKDSKEPATSGFASDSTSPSAEPFPSVPPAFGRLSHLVSAERRHGGTAVPSSAVGVASARSAGGLGCDVQAIGKPQCHRGGHPPPAQRSAATKRGEQQRGWAASA